MIIILIILIIFVPNVFAQNYKEKDYQVLWCEQQGGITEYVLDDKTRVDCLLPEYAVEFDFAKKWAESIGQSLYYAIKTNRKPGVVLILKSDKDNIYLLRLQTVGEKYNIKIWTMYQADIPFK